MNTVNFGVNESRKLVIAMITDAPARIWSLHSEWRTSEYALRTRRTLLEGDRYNVGVSLVAGRSGEVFAAYRFALNITRQPEFDVELMMLS